MKLINDKYQIIKEFETLGFANTYVAKNIEDNKKVIIKELVINDVKNWKSFELFEREGKALKNLKHDFIPEYIDTFHIDNEEGSSFYLIQEYIEGKSLQERINDGERFSIDVIYKIANTILDTLSYLSSLNPPVIHRDIKPSNIMMTDDKEVYLIDFGAIQNVGNTNSQGTTVVGTTGFMAPEQLMGKASQLSDLYSLGVTLITLLSHKNPIDLAIKKMKIQYKEYINSSIDENFIYFLDKLIEPDSEERVQSANEALDMLNKVLKGESLINLPEVVEGEAPKALEPIKVAKKIHYQNKKFHKKIIGISLALILVLVLLVFIFYVKVSPKMGIKELKEKTATAKIPKKNEHITIKANLEGCIKQNLIKEKVSTVSLLKSFECKNFNLSSKDLKEISNFKNITRLDLSNNQIDDITEIGKLTNLESLSLTHNKLKDITPISKLKNLERLYIYKNHIEDLKPLSGLNNLKYLTVMINNIEDISPLASLTSLENLSFSFNKVKSLKALSNLKNLKTLEALRNNITTTKGIEELVNLKTLKLNNNNISDISKLGNLKNLKWLDISDNKISDISILKNLTRINYLLIGKNNITDISAISYLTNLETLWAGQNNIEKLPNLSNLKQIKRLSLWNNNITDLSPLKNIQVEKELDIKGNNIKDFSFISHIKNIKK